MGDGDAGVLPGTRQEHDQVGRGGGQEVRDQELEQVLLHGRSRRIWTIKLLKSLDISNN